jgi:hypothetical protein
VINASAAATAATHAPKIDHVRVFHFTGGQFQTSDLAYPTFTEIPEPATAGLVAAGIALGLAPLAPKVSLTKDLIYTALLSLAGLILGLIHLFRGT